MQECVGRVPEKRIFEAALHSPEAEMIAVTGRRRVGKTFLIRSYFAKTIDFEITGIHKGTLKEQLQNFSYLLADLRKEDKPSPPSNWIEAFHQLTAALEALPRDRKKVVFIDELPWLATPRSGFMKALGNFWNSWAVKKEIVILLCGSAASWMVRKLVHDKGGLHNRITHQLELKPFSLHETAAYLASRNIALDHYQLIQLYMVTGGIPHYLREVQMGLSAAQNVDRLCFEPQGSLQDEFSKLYASLFDRPDAHVRAIRALAQHRNGLTRKAILQALKVKDGGSISRLLQELESSGFITTYQPFGKLKKESIYRLSDEYSLFYLKFMERSRSAGAGTWLQLSQAQAWKTWSGYAFESLCLKHVAQIKKALGIYGVYAEISSFFAAAHADRKGLQVDLLIDRRDQVINFCEIKFHDAPFTLTKAYADELREKMNLFKTITGTRKQVSLTMITAFGFQHNAHSIGLVQHSIAMDALFGDA